MSQVCVVGLLQQSILASPVPAFVSMYSQSRIWYRDFSELSPVLLCPVTCVHIVDRKLVDVSMTFQTLQIVSEINLIDSFFHEH